MLLVFGGGAINDFALILLLGIRRYIFIHLGATPVMLFGIGKRT